MAAMTTVLSSFGTEHRSWVRPFAIFGTSLQPNVLLMAKLIVLALLLQRQWPLSRHFLPFFSFFDHFGSPSTFHIVLLVLFLAGSAALLLNWYVRVACAVLGVTILISILASRPMFSNNLAYCAALLFMASLQEAGREPRLLRLQVIMLYFGAGLNKLLDPDWRSGQFFEYWFGHVHNNPWYLQAAGHLPPLVFSKIASWISFSTELGISALLLFRQYPIAIWLILALHTGMLVLTDLTFQMFYFAACASCLAFVIWPQERMLVLYDSNWNLCLRAKRFFERLDLEQRCEWISLEKRDAQQSIEDGRRDSLYLHVGKQQYQGFAALRMLLLYNPLTYFALVVILRAPDVLHLRRWIALAALVFFSPFVELIGQRIFRAWARNRSRLSTTTCTQAAA